MTDQYKNSKSSTLVMGGGQGQPIDSAGSWFTPGSNYVPLQEEISCQTVSDFEGEIRLPANRLEYVDLLITGTLANATWAGDSGPAVYLTDLISRLRITNMQSNTPLDVKGAEIRAVCALQQPATISSCYDAPLLSTLTGAATTGLINVTASLRIWGPWQLSSMANPCLRIQFSLGSVATSASLTVRASVMMSNLQTSADARGTYLTVETRPVGNNTAFSMGASMVQDIMILTGQATAAAAAAQVTKIATMGMPADQSFNYVETRLIRQLAEAWVMKGPNYTPTMGIGAFALLTTGTSVPGLPIMLERVDLSHQAFRQLIVERVSGASAPVTVICRNQVLG